MDKILVVTLGMLIGLLLLTAILFARESRKRKIKLHSAVLLFFLFSPIIGYKVLLNLPKRNGDAVEPPKLFLMGVLIDIFRDRS